MSNKSAILALLALLGAAPARAMDPDIMSVIGQPVLALAQRPEGGVVLRPASGGHRGVVAEALREAGPGVGVVGGRWLHGHGCNPEGCRVRGIFLAWDMKGGADVHAARRRRPGAAFHSTGSARLAA